MVMTNRAPIVEVALEGFKGFDRTFTLAKLTLLTGDNGLGKSAVIEAIKWCLTGVVPSGRTKDEAAKFFGERGGSVKLTDGNGNWIKRTLAIDHESKRVSTSVESQNEGTPRGEASRASDFWGVNETALEISNFLALSATKRREFVLQLVSTNELPPIGDVLFQVGTSYAKQIAGEAATLDTLHEDAREDLSEETAALAERFWLMWSILKTYHLGAGSQFWLQMTNAAGEAKLAARRTANEAKAAIRELETEAKGARAAAARVEVLRVESEGLQEELRELESRAALRKEKQRAWDSCALELKARDKEHADMARSLRELGELGDKPKPISTLVPIEAEELKKKQEAYDAEVFLDERRVIVIDCTARAGYAREDGERIQVEPTGRLVEYLATHYGSDDVLGVLLDEVTSDWRRRREDATKKLAGMIAEVEEATALLTGNSAERTDRVVFLERDVTDCLEKLADAKQHWLREQGDRASEIDTWHSKKNQIALYTERRKSADKAFKGLSERLKQLERELKGFDEVDTEEVRKAALKAEFDYSQAQKAAGAVLAYERSTARAINEKLKERSWAFVERAIQRAREVLVAEIVKPIIGDIQALLACAERSESVYLLLENDRGAPIFDLGWIEGESRRSLDSLSGGESVFFVSALAIAISKRVDSRRLLLVEADSLDESALRRYLNALAKMDVQLDACVVATNRPITETNDWLVTTFNKDGRVSSRKAPASTATTKVRLKKTVSKKKARKS